jgi:nucleoid DNA-binding protein
MDPKQLAEEIIDSLFSEQTEDERENIDQEEPFYDEDVEDDLYEEYDEDEDEDEEDEDEDEDYEDEDEGEDEGEAEDAAPSAKTPQAAPNQGNSAASLQMKPSMASPALPAPAASGGNDLEHDAHGGSAHDTEGKGFQLGTKDYVGAAPGQLAATLEMKPSNANPQIPVFSTPSMNMEHLVKDVKAMFGGSEDLSEEFVTKAASLYEAAIVTKVNTIATALRSELAEQFEQKIQDVKSTLEEQLDTYLNYVVEEWTKENEIAIENGLRTEIAENFIRGLKNLFTESYIEVPEEKTNVFDELSEAVSHLENRLNEEIEQNAKLVTKIKHLRAREIFTEQTNGLTSYQIEQLRPLVENLSFEGEKDFSEKISVLVEGVVNTAQPKKQTKSNSRPLIEKVILDEETEVEEEPITNETMALYSKVLERTIQK